MVDVDNKSIKGGLGEILVALAKIFVNCAAKLRYIMVKLPQFPKFLRQLRMELGL